MLGVQLLQKVPSSQPVILNSPDKYFPNVSNNLKFSEHLVRMGDIFIDEVEVRYIKTWGITESAHVLFFCRIIESFLFHGFNLSVLICIYKSLKR